MIKMIRFIQTYLLVAFPFVIACMVWQTIYPGTPTSFVSKIIVELLGWNLMIWFAVLILFLFLLVLLPSVREKTLRRLANLKERDEREEYITGKASRSAYVATLSLMIFFLFFSMFSFNIYRSPEQAALTGKRHTAAIQVGFSLLDNKPAINDSQYGEPLFKSKNFSLSTTAILLILISWQLLAFNLAARKEQVKE